MGGAPLLILYPVGIPRDKVVMGASLQGTLSAILWSVAQRGSITMDDRQLKAFEKALRAFPRAHALAVRGMLNTAAFQARREWQKNIKARMVVRARGKFGAVGSIRVDRARGGAPTGGRSVVGSIAPYMSDQEFGGTRRAGGKRGVPIPSRFASGEGRGRSPRKRLVRESRSLRAIRLSRRRNKGGATALNRNRRAMIAIKVAQKAGTEFVFLDLQRAPGIYRVPQGRGRLELVHETQRSVINIPKNPTLLPAIKTVRPRMPGIYKAELRRQLVRRRIKWSLR